MFANSEQWILSMCYCSGFWFLISIQTVSQHCHVVHSRHCKWRKWVRFYFLYFLKTNLVFQNNQQKCFSFSDKQVWGKIFSRANWRWRCTFKLQCHLYKRIWQQGVCSVLDQDHWKEQYLCVFLWFWFIYSYNIQSPLQCARRTALQTLKPNWRQNHP